MKKSLLYCRPKIETISDYIKLFKVYPNFSNRQYAVLFNIPTYKVVALKKKIGITKPSFSNNHSTKKKFDYELCDNVDWDNKDWFEKMINIGLNYLIRITKKNAGYILRRIKKFGLKLIGAQTHPCNTYGWLEYHYIIKKWRISDCAKFAGVSRDTMSRWLLASGLKI